MSNEHIPTELQENFDQLRSEFTDENVQQILDEIRQEAAAFDMNAIPLAKAALAELVSKDALEIYRRDFVVRRARRITEVTQHRIAGNVHLSCCIDTHAHMRQWTTDGSGTT